MKRLRFHHIIRVVAGFVCVSQAILWFQWHHLTLSNADNSKSFLQQFNSNFMHNKLSSNSYKNLNATLHAIKTQNVTLVNTLARPFQRWNGTFPCFDAEPDWNTIPALRRPLSKGFMYFKARKAGSSTIAGVALRIARNVATVTPAVNTSICATRFGHPPAWYNEYSRRDLLNSFLWTILREPTSRVVSEFFHFAVSRWGWNVTDDNFRWFLEQNKNDIDNYYLYFMKTDERLDRQQDNYVEVVSQIMRDYNFIGILERLDESLVVLQMLLHLKTSDILYLKSKVHGGYDDGVYNDTCFYIQPSYISPSLREWMKSSQYWHNFTRGDNLLYATAYKSLDMTIDHLGRGKFKLLLKRFQHALTVASERCSDKVVYPCSANGTRNEHHDCYWTDSGCGYACLDQVALGLGI